MADESEDQWLYGDSADAKEITAVSTQADVEHNDSTPDKMEDKTQPQDDQTAEGTSEIPFEVR